MKLLVGAAAAAAALAIAAVPASFTLTSGDTAPPALDPTTSTTAASTATETSATDPTTDPTVDPTRGWEVEHPNNGQHKGWENGHHAYGESVREWARCVSTQGKDNCDAKPEPYGQSKKQTDTTESTTDPTEAP